MRSKYRLEGLDCANCAAKIENELRKHEKFRFASVNFATKTLVLEAEGGGAGAAAHREAETLARSIIGRVEPSVEVVAADGGKAGVDGKAASAKAGAPGAAGGVGFLSSQLYRIGLSSSLFILGLVFAQGLSARFGAWVEWAIFGAAYLLVGYEVLVAAAKDALRGRIFNEMFLMAIATIGAIALRELPEAVGVMLFYSVGEYFQERAVEKSRSSIAELLALRPEFARVVAGPSSLAAGEVRNLDPEAVKPGWQVEVRPGERIPLDGRVVVGESYLDTSSLTGEPLPRAARPGTEVLAGYVNDHGVLRIEVTSPFSASSVARILALVEDAASHKAPTERFMTKVAAVYTPIVVISAALLAFIPPLVIPGAKLSDWLYRALVLLVMSCPCALVISIPLGYFGGVGSASRHGILVKGAAYLDSLLKTHTVVLDKTGTLTKGAFAVRRVVSSVLPEAELVRLAAALEAYSSHPIAKAILAAGAAAEKDSGNAAPSVANLKEIRGMGISGEVVSASMAVPVAAGRLDFLSSLGIGIPESALAADDGSAAATTVHVAVRGLYAGRIELGDELKSGARVLAAELGSLGVKRIVMLTGDGEQAARSVARELGIKEYRAGLLPEGKLAALEEIKSQTPKGGRVAFVGDGMNDAPVLMAADIGIAMGGLGSDAAIEASDMVIMDDRIERIPQAMRIAAQTRRIVLQNIVFALGVKAVFLALGASGGAGMWEAVIADVGVALAAILNSVRASKLKA
jgi:Cd2+/Zn2+-exporting ATPase